MAEFWVKGAQQDAPLDDVDRYRYKSMLIWWRILHENIYYKWKNGLLDKTIYESWQYDLRKFAKDQLKAQWKDLKPSFQPEFAEHVSNLLFDLKFVPWSDTEATTSETYLVIVGIDDNERLHIRIFDADGKFKDTDVKNLPATQVDAFCTLEQQLQRLLPPHELTGAEKAPLISKARSIAGQTLHGKA
jgi:hypothetical protein